MIHPGMSRPSAEQKASRQDGKDKQAFWDGKLGYAHAWLAVSMALIVGLALHLATGPVPSSPLMLAFFGLPLAAAVVCVRVFRLSEPVQWLSGIPLAVTSTAAALVLALFGGVLPSSAWNSLGLPSLWASWPFVLAGWLVALNLACAAAKRAWPLTRQNVLFLLSHAGLLVCMAGGAMSSVWQERARMIVHPGGPVAYAERQDGSRFELPFAVTLKEFNMDTFAPTLVVAASDEDIFPGSHFAKEGMTEAIGGYDVQVLKHLPKAVYASGWKAAPWKTAAPASLVRVSQKGAKVAEGWVSCGSMDVPVTMLPLPGDKVVAMPPPRPKRFHSLVSVKTTEGVQEYDVEVNKPALVKGWHLYQISYDEKMGAASEYSVLEVVHDHGVPVVFFGMFLVLAAMVWHLWDGIGSQAK